MATDFGKLKVAELREELKRLGLSQTGLKAELVARLEEASSVPANADQKDVTRPSAQADPKEAFEDQENFPQVDIQAETDHNSATTGRTPQEETSTEPQPPIEVTLAHPSLLPSSLEASVTPAPTEVRQDFHARHRRSGSPALSAKDIQHKKMEKVVPQTSAQPSPQPTLQEHDQLMGGTGEKLPQDDQRTLAREPGDLEQPPDASTQIEEDALMGEPRPTSCEGPADVEMDDAQDRHVARSIHPATNALYIKNFMRPLRPEDVEKYLLELASPPGASLDDNLIEDFFLDPVKTHALVVFASTSAASRVRSALHDRVWPDETNRKPLWVDFFPAERFGEWIRQEGGRGGRRGSSSRWEVIYDTNADGQLRVELVDIASSQYMERQKENQQQGRQRSLSPAGGFNRRPSSSYDVDIRNAPTGPRNLTENRGGYGRDARDNPSRHPGRTLDNDMLETRAFPYVSFKPVPKELANNRLDTLDRARSKNYSDRMQKGGNKEYHRYYFENGNFLVNRGPEIFIEIRPPRRVREQRRGRGSGGGPRRRRRNGGGRSGGGGGGFAMYHGVPRGGDRFRPGVESGGGPSSSRFRN